MKVFLNKLILSTSKLSFHSTIVSIIISAVSIIGVLVMIYISGLQVQAQNDTDKIVGCMGLMCLDSRGTGGTDSAITTGYDLTEIHRASGSPWLLDLRMWVYPTAHPRTVPLYEYVNQYDLPGDRYWHPLPVHVHKFYYSTKVLDLRNSGYKLIGIAGYIYPLNTPEAARPGTVPLIESFDRYTGVYFYGTYVRSSPASEVGYVFDHYAPGTNLLRTYLILHFISGWGVVVPFMLSTYFYSIHETEINQIVERFSSWP